MKTDTYANEMPLWFIAYTSAMTWMLKWDTVHQAQ